MNNHIQEGKKELNLDAYTNKPARYQYHKLEEIEKMVRENEMPLASYTWIHKDAILTKAEKNIIYEWVSVSKATMEAQYPKDSLIRPTSKKGQIVN